MPSSEGSQPPDRLLTKQELAEYLQRTPRTIDNYIRHGRMPYVRCGGGKRFDRRDVDEWLRVQDDDGPDALAS